MLEAVEADEKRNGSEDSEAAIDETPWNGITVAGFCVGGLMRIVSRGDLLPQKETMPTR